MQSVLFVVVFFTVWAALWRYTARYCRGKGLSGVVSHLGGTSVGFFAGTIVFAILAIASYERDTPKTPEPAKALATVPNSAPAPPPETTPQQQLEPQQLAALLQEVPPAGSERRQVAKGRTLKLSSAQLLNRLPNLNQTSAPLANGTPRDTVKIAPLVQLELIGDLSDVSSYTVMFALPNDNNAMVIESAAYTTKVLMNTFPSWTKEGNNAATWFANATARLANNVRRNRENPKSVVLERDGKRVSYSAVPALGLFFLTVEPL
ncbi:hypothetical protein D9M68_101280 [compost metagenome]